GSRISPGIRANPPGLDAAAPLLRGGFRMSGAAAAGAHSDAFVNNLQKLPFVRQFIYKILFVKKWFTGKENSY
ncbi:hypothetical protein O4J55_09230, partial [Paracoccus sp. PXZ]